MELSGKRWVICASPSPLPQAALVSKLVPLTKGGTRGLQNDNTFSLIGSPAAHLCTHSLVQSGTLTPVMPFWKYKGFVLQNDNSFSPAACLCTHWSSVGHSHQCCHSGSTRGLYYRMATAFPSCAPQLPTYALTHWSSLGHSHQLCHSGSTRSLYYQQLFPHALPSCPPKHSLIQSGTLTPVVPFWKYKESVLQSDNSFSLMHSPAAHLSTHWSNLGHSH